MADLVVSDHWRSRRVFVTGATGFLGSHITRLLVEAGSEVTVLERDRIAAIDTVDAWRDRVTWVFGDVTDQALLERAMGERESEVVLHLAAQTQVEVANRNPVSTYDSNVRGTWSFLEAVRRSPAVDRVVLASSDKAYGAQPALPYTEDMPLLAVNPYDVSKAAADMVATSYHRVFGVPVSITRCGNFFGPGDTNWNRLVPGTIRSLLRGERPVVRSDGSLVRDYLYVVDGALAYLDLAEAMATNPATVGEAFNFSTESQLSVLELIELIAEVTGRPGLEPIIENRVQHEIPHQFLSAAKARERLDWKPRWSVREALEITADWYRRHLVA